jgi:hypothetical protein
MNLLNICKGIAEKSNILKVLSKLNAQTLSQIV